MFLKYYLTLQTPHGALCGLRLIYLFFHLSYLKECGSVMMNIRHYLLFLIGLTGTCYPQVKDSVYVDTTKPGVKDTVTADTTGLLSTQKTLQKKIH